MQQQQQQQLKAGKMAAVGARVTADPRRGTLTLAPVCLFLILD